MMTTPEQILQCFDELCILPPTHAAASLYRKGLLADITTLAECQTIADLIALSTGPNTPPRALHALLLALFAVRSQGSLCLPLAVVETELAPFCASQAECQTVATELRAALEQEAWPTLIGPTPQSPIVRVQENLYFQRYYRHEASLEARLHKLCLSPPPANPVDAIDLVERIRQCATYRGFELNTEQRHGVYLACRNRYTIISGGPGTGKTTLVASLLRALWHMGVRDPGLIRLVAPTGRAAHRLGDSLRASLASADEPEEMIATLSSIEGSTIHRLLRYSPSQHTFLHREQTPIDADLVICDEVSMIDVVLMDQLLAAIPPHARVIFLGDRDQLPSVEAGAVLSELIPRHGSPSYSASVAQDLARLGTTTVPESPSASATPDPIASSVLDDHIVLLRQSHRTKGDVSRVALGINAGDTSVLDSCTTVTHLPDSWAFQGSSCIHLPTDTPPDQTAISWVHQFLCQDLTATGTTYVEAAALPITPATDGSIADSPTCDALFETLARGQILTLTRHGTTGCETLNRAILRNLCHHLPRSRATGHPSLPLPGLPIMITRNDRLRNLYNGDIGIMLQTPDAEPVALFPRPNHTYAAFSIHQLPEHTSAFAITIHKSQGSEYGNVLIMLPEDPAHRLLSRELIYTGITRSKGNVYLHASREVLETAISRTIHRYSGSRLWQSEFAS